MDFIPAHIMKWANAQKTAINMVVDGHPFTAASYDVEAHGRELFQRAVDGEFGAIEDYEPPSLAVLADIVRGERNELLASTDWTQQPDVPQATREKWVVYRQALRDVPQQSGFPSAVVWPDKP